MKGLKDDRAQAREVECDEIEEWVEKLSNDEVLEIVRAFRVRTVPLAVKKIISS